MPRITPAPDLGRTLAPTALPGTDGSTSTLGDLWEKGPAVLVHLRHFG